MMNDMKKQLIEDIKFKLSAYDGSYPFLPEDDMTITLWSKNTYELLGVWMNDDRIYIRILTEWGDDVEADGTNMPEKSLQEICDAIDPPKNLFVFDKCGNTIYFEEVRERIPFGCNALNHLKKTFNLNWEQDGSEWEYKYTHEGSKVLSATFE